jgi:hypothetical protein
MKGPEFFPDERSNHVEPETQKRPSVHGIESVYENDERKPGTKAKEAWGQKSCVSSGAVGRAVRHPDKGTRK